MRISILLVIALALVSLPLAAENVEGILVDKMCSSKIVEKGYGAAKAHTKMCALMDPCKASGFGVVTADGKFLKFDKKGDQQALKALEATDKDDNITVKVDGNVSGGNIKVENLSLT